MMNGHHTVHIYTVLYLFCITLIKQKPRFSMHGDTTTTNIVQQEYVPLYQKVDEYKTKYSFIIILYIYTNKGKLHTFSVEHCLLTCNINFVFKFIT
jgi:hypothetical protein